MKIGVCIKQVPEGEIRMDEKTGSLIRSGKNTTLNPYDKFPLELALLIKEEIGAEITAITMGPENAQEVLIDAFALGVDRGVHLCDVAFSGADVYATSYTLFRGIEKVGGFDLILLGQQTTDGDTAQVGPSLASWLDLPFVSWVKEVDIKEDGQILLKASITSGISKISLATPCVLSIENGINSPRTPSIKGKIQARNKKIEKLTLLDLSDKNPENYGLFASPTQVRKIFSPEKGLGNTMKEYSAVEAIKIIEKEITKLGGEISE